MVLGKRRTKATSLTVFLVFFLLALTATSLVASFPARGPGQLGRPEVPSPSSQRVAAVRAPSSGQLEIKWVSQTYLYWSPLAAVADVDGDGRPEILVDSEYSFYCLSGTGEVKWYRYGGGYESLTPAVGDIDGDGKMEIIVAHDSYNRIYCMSGSGFTKWTDQSSARFVSCSPTVADIHQNGRPVILVGSSPISPTSCMLYCINGSDVVEWVYPTGGSISSSPTVADVQGDGRLEILVTGANETFCLSDVGGSIWNFTAPGGAWYSPAVADVDGDGKKEVIVGYENGNVYCLNASGGLKWTYSTGDIISLSSVSVADIDEDGRSEIFFSTIGGVVYCLEGNGSLKWNYSPVGGVYGPVIAADVDLDNDLEIVFGTLYRSLERGGVVYCLDSSGGVEFTYGTGYDELVNPFVVSDVDLDGKPEVIVPANGLIYCLSVFVEQQAPIVGPVLLILVGFAATLILMTSIVVVRRGGSAVASTVAGSARGARRRRRRPATTDSPSHAFVS
jgi:hypothetical protein